MKIIYLNLLKKKKKPLILILDCITDPQNLGSCLRSAEGAGVDLIIVPRNKSVKLNSVAKKISCGASEYVPLIRVINLARTLNLLKNKNIWIIGTSEKVNHNFYFAKMNRPLALIMGSEEFGIRKLTYKYCDEIINIPMLGSISSLNVSIATGICLFEAVRQRRNKILIK